MRILFILIFAACSHPPAAVSPSAHTPPTPTARSHDPAQRFDEKVRQDFFDGMRGDAAAMDRAQALCDAALAKNPAHAEAMVWHGAVLLARSSTAFRTGDTQTGLQLYATGLAQMDAAVALEPTNVGVRIPRGAVLLAMAPYVPEPEKAKLLHRGVDDYEATLAAQQSYFGKLTLHAREQLLYGLTDGYANLGQSERATASYQRMLTDAAGSELLPRAKTRAAGEPVTGQTPCEQCHARAR
jgi:hypothetical protein